MTQLSLSNLFCFVNASCVHCHSTANDLLSSPMDDLVMANDDACATDVAGKISSPGISKMSTSMNEDSTAHPPLVTDSPSVIRQSVSPVIRMSSTNQC